MYRDSGLFTRKARKAAVIQRMSTTKKIHMPAVAIAAVIGKKKKNLDYIEEMTNIRPSIDSDQDCVILEGSAEDVQKAEHIIKDMIEPETVELKESQIGMVIGKGGKRINSIGQETGAKIYVKDYKAHIMGTKNQKSKAKYRILRLLAEPVVSKRTGVYISKDLVGRVFGKSEEIKKRISEQTNTFISYNLEEEMLYICGETVLQEHNARCRIKQAVLPYNNVKCSAIEGSENSMFKLVFVEPPYPTWSGEFFEVSLVDGQQCGPSNVVGYKDLVLKKLQHLDPEKDAFEIDLWSHIGHAYIKGIDEGDDLQYYTLNELQSHLHQDYTWLPLQGGRSSTTNSTWRVDFAGGLTERQVAQLMRTFQDPTCRGPSNIRYDFSFFSPLSHKYGCRRIRITAFIKEGEDEEFPIQMKGVLRHEILNDNLHIYLCVPSTSVLKLTIIMPSRQFDCRLNLRKSPKNLHLTLKEQEEETMLMDYLRKALVICETGQLQSVQLKQDVPLPDDFDLDYFSRSERFNCHYPIGEERFTMMFSREKAVHLPNSKKDECREMIDLHLHCDDWDRRLAKGDWDPDQIIKKLDSYVEFVRYVQSNITMETEEEQAYPTSL
ncbi:uncharacterized protein LOC5511470 isoform X1 [Nematostella vectensis]|uniref:uncharacterized protein LOC5511470 isoform X1 n=1 Tax=Nematostella vectensis TaxID=45351 RepID=UPI0020773D1A|nr:uncharacterized protein LOC5511470 isoform X1 [Nematostella vectensis]